MPVAVPFSLDVREGVEAIRELIGGGYAEAVVRGDRLLWVDEDGHRRGLRLNVGASTLYGETLVGSVLAFSAREFRRWDNR